MKFVQQQRRKGRERKPGGGKKEGKYAIWGFFRQIAL